MLTHAMELIRNGTALRRFRPTYCAVESQSGCHHRRINSISSRCNSLRSVLCGMLLVGGAATAAPYTYMFTFDAATQGDISLAADSVSFFSGDFLLDGQVNMGAYPTDYAEDLNGSYPWAVFVELVNGTSWQARGAFAVPVGQVPVGTVSSFFFSIDTTGVPGPGTYSGLNVFREAVVDSSLSGYSTVAIASAGTLTIADTSTVPLPAAAWLLLSGLGGVGYFVRKARK